MYARRNKLSLLALNFFAAGCVLFDIYTGRLGCAGFLFFVLLYYFVKFLLVKKDRAILKIKLSSLLLWILFLIACGTWSNFLSRQKCREIAMAAQQINRSTNHWPKGLNELAGYANRLDKYGRFRYWMSTIFIIDDKIVHQEFPGSWVSMTFDGSESQEIESW